MVYMFLLGDYKLISLDVVYWMVIPHNPTSSFLGITTYLSSLSKVSEEVLLW